MATITKKLGFENLLPNASMSKDSNNDGVVDGWVKKTDTNATASWLFDTTEQCQAINVTTATGLAFPGLEISSFIPVSPNVEYTFSVYLKAEGVLVAGSTGPRLEISWFNSAQEYITNSLSSTFTNTVWTRQSVTGIAPYNAVYAKVRVVFRCADSSAFGTVWIKQAQFEQSRNLLANPALNVITPYALSRYLGIDECNSLTGWTKSTNGTITASGSVIKIDDTSTSTSAYAYKSGIVSNPGTIDMMVRATAGRWNIDDGAREFQIPIPNTGGVFKWYRVRLNGTSATLYENGVLVGTYSQATTSTNNYVSFYIDTASTGTIEIEWIAWSNQDLGAPTGAALGWTVNTTSNAIYSIDQSAQKISTSGTWTGTLYLEVRQEVPVIPGQSYSLAVDAQVSGTVTAVATIEWLNASGGSLGFGSSASTTSATFTRIKVEGQTPPAGAAKARVILQLRANQGTSGSVWFKNAKFEQNATATNFGAGNPNDYEETDFFTIVNPAADADNYYTYGWEKTTVKKESGVYGYRSVSSGPSTSPTIALKFSTPENAGTVTLRFWADTSELPSGDTLRVWDGGELVIDVPIGQVRGYTATIRRGSVFLMFQHSRGASTTGNAYIDGIEISWDEVTPNPAPTPPTAEKVYVIDFESETYDPFFTVKEKADGYTYGFKKRYDRRNSGFYSLGVEDTDVFYSYPDDFSPPTIPKGATAACSFGFKIPITAINPTIRLYAYFDAENGYEKARILINGEEVWSTMTNEGWVPLEFALTPGMEYSVIVEYIRDPNTPDTVGTDSVYIDDVTVAYDIPDKPLMYVATAPVTEIKTTSTSFSVQETFENSTINKFFTVNNPAKLKSGGGSSQYPEAGWIRTSQIAYQGTYSFRAQREKTGNSEDAAVDFVFKVPHGVRNAKAEWWNFVELERAGSKDPSTGYLRLYEEFRVWVNYSLWKQFYWCSLSLTSSKAVSGKWACPWGVWWKETLNLTPGRTYTLTFELQRDSGDSSPIHGRNLCCIDNLTVSWTETPGDVTTTPPQPLIFFDGRDGYTHLYDRSGAEMAPLSFSEYKVYGSPGSVHQFTQIEPRDVEFPVLIESANWNDTRQKIRNLTTQLANKPLVLGVAQPEGEVRELNCRFVELTGRETPDEHMATWKKVVLSFRGFDPFWYGERIVVDGAVENLGDPTWIKVTNPGDADAWPIIKIYGPITDPLVKLTTMDDTSALKQFKLTGYILGSGRYIVVDTRPGRKTVILDDGTNLYQYLDASINELFAIPQGDYRVDLNGTGTDANTKIVVEFQPPYWGV